MRIHAHPSHPGQGDRRRQRGAAIVEFALVALLFFTILIGIMDFGRWLFTLNAAAEATRLGARLAAVCGKSDQDKINIRNKMNFFLGLESDKLETQISINYTPDNDCSPDWTATNVCESVTVQLVQGAQGAKFTAFTPFLGGSYAIPPFTTTLPRELMNSVGNPMCKVAAP